MIKSFSKMLVLTTLILSTASLAGDKVPVVPGTPGTPGTPISFEDLKQRCLNPEQFDVQRAPQNIKLLCTDTRMNWLAAQPGEINLEAKRRVTTGIFADKFFVDAVETEIPIIAKSGSCHIYKEVEETITVERPLSCAEILAMKGELTDLCASVLDAAKGANPKLVDVRETGRQYDTCGGVLQRGSGKGSVK